jgi:Ca-activated chloride channel family protein
MISELWDKLDPGFFAPVWLLVGLMAVIAVVLLEIGARRRRAQAVRLFAASHLATALTGSVSPLKRLLKTVLLVAAVGLLFVAMARPHLLFDWKTAPVSTSFSPSIAPKAC